MKLAPIFTDCAVFQKGQPIRIFGKGAGKVKVEFLGEVFEQCFDGAEWLIELPACEYGGPYEMRITLDGAEHILHDVYVGEVWLAGGQSNMEMPLYRVQNGIEDAEKCDNDLIRFFTVPRRAKPDDAVGGWNFAPTDGNDTPWMKCCESSALYFSAIGFYVARELHEHLGCAIGIISCNWGGKIIEAFIGEEWIKNALFMRQYYNSVRREWDALSDEEVAAHYTAVKEALELRRDLVKDIDEIDMTRRLGLPATSGYPKGALPNIPAGPYSPNGMSRLYDSMYSRIIPYSINGILWYQGESNTAENYLEKYLLYMRCMKESFKNPELCFYAVELASYGASQVSNGNIISDRFVSGDNWAFKREAQQRATEIATDNYLVTSMGLGDVFDIHPANKKELSHRIAIKVLKHTYGFDIKADQPIFKKAHFEGNRVIIEIENSEGIFSSDLWGVCMYVADEQRELKKANVSIEDDKIILTCDEISNPILVRYAFDNYYGGTHIYNSAGLPLQPFRTDCDGEDY